MACLNPQNSPSQPLLLVMSGPSGVGKNSLAHALLRRHPTTLRRVVTATDRPRRPSETQGVDYHFLSTAEFERLIEEEELIEWAVVYGQYKGIPEWALEQALESGQDVLVLVDIQGAAAVRDFMPQAISVFVAPPSEAELVRRLRKRGGDTERQVEARISTAREEMCHLEEFDYLVINYEGRLDQAVEQIEAILTAERCRIRPASG